MINLPEPALKPFALGDCYTADQLKQSIRDALEEAAKVVAETKEWKNGKWTSTICPTTTEAVAAAIRKLKEDIQ